MTITEAPPALGGPQTDERVEITVFDQLVTDFVIPCDGFDVDIPCERAAEYAAHMTCCGQQYLLCPDCLLDTISYVRYIVENGKRIRCRKCRTQTVVNDSSFFVIDGRI